MKIKFVAMSPNYFPVDVELIIPMVFATRSHRAMYEISKEFITFLIFSVKAIQEYISLKYWVFTWQLHVTISNNM